MVGKRAQRRERSSWPFMLGLACVAAFSAGFFAYSGWPVLASWAPAGLMGKLSSAPLRVMAPGDPVATVPPVEAGPPVAVRREPIVPSFDIARVTAEGSAVIAGRAAPGSDVTVYDAEHPIGESRADANGEFVIVPGVRLLPGGRELTLRSRDRSGAEVRGTDSVVVLVPEIHPTVPAPRLAEAAPVPAVSAVPAPGVAPEVAPAVAPVVAPVVAPAASPALALLIPQDMGAATRLLQGPAAGGKRALSLDTVDYDSHGEIRFSGSAKPAAPVRVYVDNKPVGDASAVGSGQWTLTPPQSVAPGVHQLRVDQLSADGQVQSRVEMPFQRTEVSAETLASGKTVVQPGTNLWRIARQTYGSGARYTVIYLANREQIRDPNRIYPGQIFALPTGY